MEQVNRIRALVDQHNRWRSECLNLVAAETCASPSVKQFAATDLAGRYGDYAGRDLDARKYYGTKFVVEIEREVEKLARRVFRADHIELRPLSGHIAGAAVIMGVTKPGDCVLEVGSDGGGHRLAEKLRSASLAELDVGFLPIDGKAYNIDVSRALRMMEERRPSLVILGSSNFLFPHPVSRIAEGIRRLSPRPVLAYDASHVLGFLAAGQFQDPLAEGADVVLGSTHKTLPGPQGGVIFSNSEDLINRISAAAYPGLITNHHLARLPGLGVALLEMIEFGKEYAEAVVNRARAFGEGISRRGLQVVGSEQGFTCSHTILVSTEGWGDSKVVAAALESSNVIVNSVVLPAEQGGQGLRFGVQELTRRGADASFMDRVAALVVAVIRSEVTAEQGKDKARGLAAKLPGLRYSVD